MASLSATAKARGSAEPVGGKLIGNAYIPSAATDDTIDLSQVFPGVNKVLWATINGTANHASINCDMGGTAKITLGTGNISEGELLFIGTSE